MPFQETATLLSVEYLPEASSLVGDHAAGVSVLSVASGRVFGDDGTVRIAGTSYTYERDEDTLTIIPTLGALAEDGAKVERVNAAGDPEGRLVAHIDFDGDDLSDSEAEIRTADRGYFPEGTVAAGTLVDVVSTDYGYQTVSRPVDPAALDAVSVATVFLSMEANTQTIPDNVSTDVTFYGVGIEQGGWVYDPARFGFRCPKTGFYRTTAAARWVANGTGRRAVWATKRDLGGVRTDGWADSRPAESSLGFSVVAPWDTFIVEGHVIGMRVLQNSGAGLDLRVGPSDTLLTVSWIGEYAPA